MLNSNACVYAAIASSRSSTQPCAALPFQGQSTSADGFAVYLYDPYLLSRIPKYAFSQGCLPAATFLRTASSWPSLTSTPG